MLNRDSGNCHATLVRLAIVGRRNQSTTEPVERFLRLFARVEHQEGTTALLLVANILLILVAYYLIKPVREGWIAVSVFRDLSTLEVKAFSAFAQSLLLSSAISYAGVCFYVFVGIFSVTHVAQL